MTKYWITLMRRTRRAADVTLEFPMIESEDDLFELLQEACKQLNQATPLILSKHLNDLESFHHTRFWPSDFMEAFPYDYMEVFELPEEDPKKKSPRA